VKNYLWNEKGHLFAYTFLLPRTLRILHASESGAFGGLLLLRFPDVGLSMFILLRFPDVGLSIFIFILGYGIRQ
jgi:hypothetical protein